MPKMTYADINRKDQLLETCSMVAVRQSQSYAKVLSKPKRR